MSKKGGYVIVDLKGKNITTGSPFTLDGVTARLDRAKNKACLLSGFAIGNDEKRDVFVDLQKTEDGYVALFGQYTITIEDDEITITDGGVLMNNIVDSKGTKRFIEGDGNKETVTGFTFNYCKWSLSGTHLMVVLSGSVTNGTTITNGVTLATINLPDYVTDKIIPVWFDNIEAKSVKFMATDWSQQSSDILLRKSTTGLMIVKTSELTLTADRNFRVQFDLLIDSVE